MQLHRPEESIAFMDLWLIVFQILRKYKGKNLSQLVIVILQLQSFFQFMEDAVP